jgi:hypothetical protein
MTPLVDAQHVVANIRSVVNVFMGVLCPISMVVPFTVVRLCPRIPKKRPPLLLLCQRLNLPRPLQVCVRMCICMCVCEYVGRRH